MAEGERRWHGMSRFLVWQAVAQGVLSGMEYVRTSAPASWRAMGQWVRWSHFLEW